MPSLARVLIANRGEIACRVIRSARQLGLKTIAVFSEADRDAPHARLADEAVCLGPAPASESYLSIEKILAAARARRADCVHPGYGFLAENADFAQACADAGLVFVGPSPAAMRALGDKSAAKALMQSVGTPILPGYHGPRQEVDFLLAEAEKIGFPALIKACAGGGGKGMRRVDRREDFAEALASARRQAAAAFGDDRVLVEKCVARPRHVEMQIFGDAHGCVAHLFERDCSLQRLHQKIIEEAPAPGLSAAMRAQMGAAAVKAAAAVGYVGAGTVEFIVDAERGLRADAFWFMEMNARLQVEHAVTEAILGLDLVALQFRVAAGEPLGFTQEDLRVDGHAVEARLYAEDPARGFLPSSGRLLSLRLPDGEGVRVDAGVIEGSEVTPYYDALIAKIIAHGATREQALERLEAALARTQAIGPRCNLALLAALVAAPEFRAGRFDTGFVERFLQGPGRSLFALDAGAVAAAVRDLVDAERQRSAATRAAGDPWGATDCFELAPPRRTPLDVVADGRPLRAVWSRAAAEDRVAIPDLDFESQPPDAAVFVDGARRLVWRALRQTEVSLLDPAEAARSEGGAQGAVVAPMPGRVAKLFVAQKARVREGQPVAVVEAMKMEHVLRAPRAGDIALHVREGDRVALGAPLFEIAACDDEA